MRVLGTNVGFPDLGIFTKTPGALTNDFFVNPLDMDHRVGRQPPVRPLLRRLERASNGF